MASDISPDPADAPSGGWVTEYAALIERKGDRAPEVAAFERAHAHLPGADAVFRRVRRARAARFWRRATPVVWGLSLQAAAGITALAVRHGRQARDLGTEVAVARTEADQFSQALKGASAELAQARAELREPLVAAVTVAPDANLGPDDVGVAVDEKGVFRVKDLPELRVRSPRDGYATLLWLDPKWPQIFPKPAAGRPATGWKVRAGKTVPFDAPLPKPQGPFVALVVITPTDATDAIRHLVPLIDPVLIRDPDRIQGLLTERLRLQGQPWVSFGQVPLAPFSPPK